MCGKNVLNEITGRVCAAAKEVLGDKLEKVVLFGSYARGDYDEESDIDIMILSDITPEVADATQDRIRGILGNLILKYDVIVSMILVCSSIYHKYKNHSGFYLNLQKDGVDLYAA